MKPQMIRISVLFLLLATAPVIVAIFRSSASFDINAESEYVRYTPELDPPQQWVMDSVSLFSADDTTAVALSGELQFTDSVHVTVERRSGGPLRVEIEPTRQRQRTSDAAPLRIGVFRKRSGGHSNTVRQRNTGNPRCGRAFTQG
jgi:hypothetical protein